MKSQGRNQLVLAIYPQTRGIAFVLFEHWGAPVDWAVHEIRGKDKNARSLKRIDSIFAWHTPDVILLQDMSQPDANRAPRIQKLNREIAALAERRGISVRIYARRKIRRSFARYHRAKTKQHIAEAIAKDVPALSLYVPPARKKHALVQVDVGTLLGRCDGAEESMTPQFGISRGPKNRGRSHPSSFVMSNYNTSVEVQFTSAGCLN